MRFLLIISLLLVGNAAWWWYAHRWAGKLKARRIWRGGITIFSSVLVGYLLFFVIAPGQARHAHSWLPMPMLVTIYLWHLLVMPAAVIGIGLLTIGQRALSVGRSRFIRTPRANTDNPSGRDMNLAPTRRQFITAAIAAPPLVAVGLTGNTIAHLDDLRVRRFSIPVANLPPTLDGLTIAHVSDIHIGRFTRPRTLAKITETTNQLRADLVLMTGDLIDLALSDLPTGIDLMRMLDSKFGIVMIEGNHDLFEDAFEFEQRVRNAGLALLLNSSTTLKVGNEAIQIMGIRWGQMRGGVRRYANDANIDDAVNHVAAQLVPGAFPILLAHHPHAFDAAAAAGIPLTLSGHTHGGQLMLNEKLGAGPIMFRYWSGLYRKSNASAMVVSNGCGNWFPLRINAPAEIVHITLRRGGLSQAAAKRILASLPEDQSKREERTSNDRKQRTDVVRIASHRQLDPRCRICSDHFSSRARSEFIYRGVIVADALELRRIPSSDGEAVQHPIVICDGEKYRRARRGN
jgi:predicted MPP superfamily phosphohydrolase